MSLASECGQAAAGAVLHCDCQAMNHLLHLGDDLWSASDHDPQFLLTFPVPQGAGVYRITAMLQGDGVMTPCLYMDLGEGWSEAACLHLESGEGGTRWTVLACLSEITGPARFDPMDHAGEFRFGGVVIERLAESEALLTLLGRCASQAPTSAAAVFEQARQTAASHGFLACCRWLMSLGEQPRPASGWTSYLDWIRQFDTLSSEQARSLHEAIVRFPRRPLISLVLLVRDADEERLRSCIDSVLGQIYPDWELCLADDGSSGAAVQQMLDAYVETCSRIKLAKRQHEGRPVSWSDAFSLSTGQFAGFLDGYPELPGHAMLAFADAVIRNPGAGILYSDEDRVEESGRRVDPYFKPDWNPDLFLAQDYLNHLAIYESALVRNAGGVRNEFEDNPLHDLALRCVATLEEAGIVHIPLVLCHSRATGDATAGSSRAIDAGRRALEEHFQRGRSDVDVSEADGGYHVRHALPEPAPKVSLIIPTRDRLDLLRRCVDSILSLSTYPNFEVVIVDNQSVEAATLEYFSSLDADPRVRVLAYDSPFNYSAINNFAIGRVDGEVVGLVNNDIEVISPDWLEQMVQHAIRPGVGAVGAMLYYPDDTIQHAGVMLGIGGVAGHPYSRYARGSSGQMGRARFVQNLSAVTGACLLVRRSLYLEVGGLNERLTIAFNDVDFCLRLLAHGCRNVWTPLAELYHHESASRGSEDTPEKQARFKSEVDYMFETWSHQLPNDPAYSPNLSLMHGDGFALAFDPRHSLTQWVERLLQ